MDSWRPKYGGTTAWNAAAASSATPPRAGVGAALPGSDLCEVCVTLPQEGAGEQPARGTVTEAAVATPLLDGLSSIARAASAQLNLSDSDRPTTSPYLRLRKAGSDVPEDQSLAAIDERVALLGKCKRSEDADSSSNGGSSGAILTRAAGKEPYNTAAITKRWSSAAVVCFAGNGTGAGGGEGPAPLPRKTQTTWSPFEVSEAAVELAAGAPGPSEGPRPPDLMSSTRIGGMRVQMARAPSTLFGAATAAGDLHTAVPHPALASNPGGDSAAALARGPSMSGGFRPGTSGTSCAASGEREAGGGEAGDCGAALPRSNIYADDSAQFREYFRDEQRRHATEARSRAMGWSRTTLRRALMLGITAGFLGVSIYLARIPWGQQESSGVPVWRWFLLIGCLPSVWYIPWYTIFLLVLLLESLLPMALYGSGGGGGFERSGSSARNAMAAQVAGGGVVADGEDRGGRLVGPALVIYHILGVRHHTVRVLRSLAAQLLVHYVVVQYLGAAGGPSQGVKTVMKLWTCVTLFLTTTMLKSLMAKALSKHFHSKGYLERMQQAVKQELVLMALSKPRRGRPRSESQPHSHPHSGLGLSHHLANILGYSGNSSGAGGVGAEGAGGGGGAGRGVGGMMRSPFAAVADGAGGGSSGGDGASCKLSSRRSGDHHLSHIVSDLASGPATSCHQHDHLPHHQQQQQQAGVVTGAGLEAGVRARAGSREVPLHGSLRRGGGGGGGCPPLVGYGNEDSTHGGSGIAGEAGVEAVSGAGVAPSGSVRPPSPKAPPQAASSRSPWRTMLGALRRHLRRTYIKTQFQWNLSRPTSYAKRRLTGDGGGGDGGRGRGGRGGGSGGLVSSSFVDSSSSTRSDNPGYEQLRTSLFWLEQHIRSNKLRMGVTLSDQLRAAAEGSQEVTSKTEAKRLAFFLHLNVLGLSDLRGRKYLVARDFEPFFGSAEEVREASALFDTDSDGRITLQNMVDTIVRIYKERKKLALTLQDTRSVVAKLELICGVVMHVICGFIYLVIFQVNVRELWLTFSSVTLAFVFVFGNSIRSLYEAVLFLFVVHPFDVGDWLLLTNGDTVKVEEIALLFCTFVKGDGRRLYYPNPKLMQEPVINISRSGTYWDSASLLVDLATPGAVLETVEGRMKTWLADNPKQYTGAGGVSARTLASPSKLQLSACWEYCHSGEDQGRTTRWRSKVILVLATALEEGGVAFTFPAIKDGGRLDREAAAVVGLLNPEERAAAASGLVGPGWSDKAGMGRTAAAAGILEFGTGANFTLPTT